MVVCSSRLIAYALLLKFKDKYPEWFEEKKTPNGTQATEEELRELKPMPFMAMVSSVGKNDPAEMYNYLGGAANDKRSENMDAAFKQEILSFHSGLVFEIPAVQGDGLQGVVAGGDGLALAQAEQVVIDGGIVGRRPAVIVAVPAVHQVQRREKAVALAAAAFVIRIIEIREAEGVAEFVAEGPDAGESVVPGSVPVAVDTVFRGDGVAVEQFPIQVDRLSGTVPDRPGVGPDGRFIRAFRFVFPGYEDNDVVDFTVSVIIELGEIDARFVGLGAGVDDGLGRILVLLIFVVGEVVG